MTSARGFVRWMRTRQAGCSSCRAGYQSSSGLPTTHARPVPRPPPASPADVHGDVGAVHTPPPPELLEDDVVGALAVDHAAHVEAVEGGGDAERRVVGLEEGARDRRRRSVAPVAAKAPELLRGAVVLARNALERLCPELPHEG